MFLYIEYLFNVNMPKEDSGYHKIKDKSLTLIMICRNLQMGKCIHDVMKAIMYFNFFTCFEKEIKGHH